MIQKPNTKISTTNTYRSISYAPITGLRKKMITQKNKKNVRTEIIILCLCMTRIQWISNMLETQGRHVLGRYRTMKLCMFLNTPTFHKINIMNLQDSGKLVYEVQDYDITTKHIVTFTILVDTKLQNKI